MRKSLTSDDYGKLVEMLRALREDAGVTQVELAELLEESQSFVSKSERGERRLDVLELRQWCRALKLDFVKFVQQVDKRLGRR